MAAHYFDVLRGRPLWYATAVVQVGVATQAIFGVVLQRQTGIEAPQLHLLYGFFGLAFVGMVYSYRIQLPEKVHLLYGGAGIFLFGLSIRSFIL